jgi:GH24 family phage-related lysozyme (muramidase)
MTTTANRKLPKAGIELIKRFEGCRLTAYPDPLSGGAPWTIGWGSTLNLQGNPLKNGDRITQSEADLLLEKSLREVYLPQVLKIPHTASMSEEQIGALLSFAYNLGANFYGNPGFTTISRYLRDKDWERVPDALLLYVNPGSNVEEGLKRRRVAEGSLWHSGLSKIKQGKRLIVAKRNTLLKKQALQSFELDPREKIEVPRGRSYTIIDSVDEGSHLKVTIDYQAGTWYIYKPHWDVVIPGQPEVHTPDHNLIRLNVPYYTQLDSTTSHSARMCFSSSCAMAAEFLKPGCLGGNRGADDLYMTKYVFKYGDTTNATAQVRALKDLGIHAVFRQNLTRRDVIEQLTKNIPVPVGYLHKGPVSSPRGGGHWLVIIGIDQVKQQYIVNDPWGDCDLLYGGFLGSQNGSGLRYSFRNFEPRWMVEGNGTGWGMVIVR